MCVGPTNRDAFSDRNKYGVKRARILFTERYNCQKNKRSQSLFAHVFLHHLHQRGDGTLRTLSSGAFPPSHPSSPPLLCIPVTSPIRCVLVSFYLLSLATRSPMHASPTPSNHPVVLSLSALLGFFLLLIDSQPPSQLPWKSSLESRVNEFAITIFHVDVTTYSLVDFGKTRCVLVAYVRPPHPPQSPSSLIAMRYLKIFSSKSITKADNARLFKR